jgi:uncharacterized repeat protein (TIGR02543 family)
VVNLAPTPNAGDVFTGWSGDCSGGGACVVAMTADRTVTAAFSRGITVTAPNGGESLRKTKTATISWSYLGNPGATVKIELLKGGVLNRTISSSVSIGSGGSGSFSWRVSGSQAAGSNYRIRVTSRTAGSFTDTSDADFTIN